MSTVNIRLNLHVDHFATPIMAGKFYAIIAGVGSGTGARPSLAPSPSPIPTNMPQADP
jgi:hypothetical protein